MSEIRLVLHLDDIRAGLRQLLDSVSGSGEAGHIVEARGNRAAATIKAGYPSRSGDLRDHLEVTHTRSPFGARSVVRNTSDYALPFENGSEVRHYLSKRGVTHVTGKVAPNHLFTQTILRERRGMHEDHRAMLERQGLLVTGDAEK